MGVMDSKRLMKNDSLFSLLETLAKNAGIVKDVSEKIARRSPDSIVIVVCNPLDAMVYAAAGITGFAKNKIMGMAGAL
ncbi:hypothetical protein IIB79_08355, partial [candidate division KSB1 bacterium]|nr:hypothetical protein [candidate division KSB1 bacterium]